MRLRVKLDRAPILSGPLLVEALILFVAAVVAAFPLLLLVSNTFKSANDVKRDPFGLFTSFEFTSLTLAWSEANFSQFFINSVVITGLTVVITVPLATMAGYAFARLEFPGREWIFRLFLIGLMIPFYAMMVPIFHELKAVGLLGTPLGAALPMAAGANGPGATAGMAFGILLMRSIFMNLPEEIGDAARTDGASEIQVFLRVMLPLGIPGVAALSVLAFLQAWNAFLVPLLYASARDGKPLAVAVWGFAAGRTPELGLLAAGSMIMVIPVILVFLVARRSMISGLSSGSFK